MNHKTQFLWPSSKLPTFKEALNIKSDGIIEKYIDELYPDSHSVLFSSGRSGLSTIIKYKSFNRTNNIWIPTYSSHCVHDAISRYTMPTNRLDHIDAGLIYHQWGRIFNNEFDKNIMVIEDSVDSLILPNKSVFACGGDFSIMSLPKVFGTLAGGIVFCKSKEDSIELKKIRNLVGYSNTNLTIKFLSKYNNRSLKIWNSIEALNGRLHPILRGQVYNAFKDINKFIDIIQNNIICVEKHFNIKVDISNRCPSNIPISSSSIYYNEQQNLISAGYRMFNKSLSYPSMKWEKVLPIPIHFQVDKNFLENIFKNIIPK